jgi:hypothetical protein
MAKTDHNSGTYNDRLMLQALQLVDAATKDEKAGAAAYEAAWEATRGKDGLDPIHISQQLASMLVSMLQLNPDWRAILDRNIEEYRLIVAAEIPEAD